VNHFNDRCHTDVLTRYPAAGCTGKQNQSGPEHFAAASPDKSGFEQSVNVACFRLRNQLLAD
jgi:hypothetical protein